MTPIRFIVALMLFVHSSAIAADDRSGTEFFETKIRPTLVKQCYGCHSANAKSVKGGLMLDTRDGIRAGGDSGHAVVPYDVGASLIVDALRYDSFEMPPKGRLPDSVINDFIQWIEMGAPDSRDGAKPLSTASTAIDLERRRQHWAYHPLTDVQVPTVENDAWPYCDIDRFVLHRLEAAQMQPMDDASATKLLRRISFDLTGLPPAPQDVARAIEGHLGIESLVDRLLASPQFGERWGRHWLDVARFAESMGRTRNFPLPYAWRYRNWVFDALNADKPYDVFVREQVAGDLISCENVSDREAAIIATGFLAVGSHDLNERDVNKFRMDVVDEQINVVSRGVLATTAGCARCHDHKFDPVPTEDYYALAGIFRSSQTLVGYEGRNRNGLKPELLFRLSSVPDRASASRSNFDKEVTDMSERRRAKLQSEVKLLAAKVKRLKKLTAGNKGRKSARKSMASEENNSSPNESPSAESVAGSRRQLNEARQLLRRKTNQLNKLRSHAPRQTNYAMALRDVDEPADCRLHLRGETKNLGDSIPRGFLRVIDFPAATTPRMEGSGRLELAQWLTDADAPAGALAARVMVNRTWHHLFGQGLVRSVDNFGTTGGTPSHPRLLDHLANQFVHDGWSVKRLIRSIVLSRTYQQDSGFDLRCFESDPENRLIWKMSPRRIEVEALRDALLAISGNLVLDRPAGSPLLAVGDGEVSVNTIRRSFQAGVRSVYLPVLRGFVPQMFTMFDFAEPSEPTGRREITTVASQALFMMNSEFVTKQSMVAAKRLLNDSTLKSTVSRIIMMYQLALGRQPNATEVERAHQFLASSASSSPGKTSTAQDWADLFQSVFASAEFRYVD